MIVDIIQGVLVPKPHRYVRVKDDAEIKLHTVLTSRCYVFMGNTQKHDFVALITSYSQVLYILDYREDLHFFT
jgi:hypothetical protein